MTNVDDILKAASQRRAEEDQRKRAINAFKKSSTRDIFWACYYFFLAGIFAILPIGLLPRFAHGGGSIDLVMFASIGWGISMLHVYLGITKLYVSPRDKVILTLLEEYLIRNEPNQALEPTPIAVTVAAEPLCVPSMFMAHL